MGKIKLIYPEEAPEKTMWVALSVDECMQKINYELTAGGKLLDRHEITCDEGRRAVVSVWQHYFFRTGYVTATVTVDNFAGRTRAHWVSGGGSDSPVIDFDWGAADRLNTMIRDVLTAYEWKETNDEGKNE